MNTLSLAHVLSTMAKGVYLRHCNFIYTAGNMFYKANMPKAVEATRAFYIRNKIAQPDKDGILDVEVSLDAQWGIIITFGQKNKVLNLL